MKSNTTASSQTTRMNSLAQDLNLRRQVAPSNSITKNGGVKLDVLEAFFADLITEGKPRARGSKVHAWVSKALDRLKQQSTYDDEDLDDELNDSIHLARTRFEKIEDSYDYDDEEDDLKDSIHLTTKRLVSNEEKWQQVQKHLRQPLARAA